MRVLLLFFIITAAPSVFAAPYFQTSLETSSNEVQTRLELGYSIDSELFDSWDFYAYHESDPRNGVRGDGFPRESENGAGLRFRVILK